MPTDVGPVLAMTEAIPLLDKDTTVGSPTLGQWVIGRNNAADIRTQMLAALLAGGGSELTARPGWLPRVAPSGSFVASGLVVQQATPAQSVQMYPGTCVIARSGQGVYLCTQAATATIPLDPADGVNPRYDVVYVRLFDGGLGDPEANHGPRWCVIKGDPAASPVIPSLPAVDGVIPVVAIRRPAAVNTVADSQITDLRRSSGLLGATRFMLGGDLLTDAGLLHGERRSRVTPTALTALGAPPVLYDWWDAVNARWHGTQRLVFDVRGTSGTISDGGTRQCASLVIPDPGWRYRVSAGGTARLSSVPAGASEAGAAMQHRVGVSTFASSYTNDLCGTATLHARSGGGNSYLQAPIKTSQGDFAGSQTVYKLIQNNTGATVSYAGETETYDSFTVALEPA